MKQSSKKAFTLIELIIVIAIIAILAVTAFLVLTKWMGKSRDSRRVNDISAINSALQIYISDASLIPLPDSYSGVYDTGYALARYQGNFTDNIASQLSNISKNIKDPQGSNYGYSVTFDRKQYQVRALTENTVGYQNNVTNEVSAASQTAKMQGNYAGFLVTYTGSLHSLWNVPSLFLFSGTAITSGYLFTGGNNNFLQDNKTTDNIYPLAIVDVSNLYNSSISYDSAVYTNIINAYSGTNNVISQSGATAVVQSAAGGITLINLSTPICNAGYALLNGVCVVDNFNKLLLHFDNNVIDSATPSHTVTNNSVTFSNSTIKFGGYGASFDGSSSYLSLADSDDWNFGTGDFTIDFWINFKSFNGGVYGYNPIMSQIETVNVKGRGINFYPGDGHFQFLWEIGGTFYGVNESGGTALSLNTRYHIAIIRSGTNIYIYRNGVLTGSTNNIPTIPDMAAPFYIGYNGYGQIPNAYIDELRISKGIARRTSNFTPPASPY